jgi:ubiquinone/menaquinone biosynthesis C-methylase UbiE
MGSRKNLMRNYPVGKGRLSERPIISEETRQISKKFDFDYFDGDRKYGYGGFNYNPRFWSDVVLDFINEYKLTEKSSILDIGCAKGFMLVDFKKVLPGITISGLDISKYAISSAHPDVKNYVIEGSAIKLPYEDKTFDLVISINTLHNLKRNEIKKSLEEINRVTKKYSFIMVDGYESESQREMMDKWVLTAETVLSYDEWIEFFNESKYLGDYDFWTVS